MRVAHSIEEASGFAPSAVTIGNFDGVHAGHQHLFRQVIEAARQRNARPTALTFNPHPARIVAPERAPRLLTTMDQRCELIGRCGIEQVLLLPFNEELARLSPEEFVEKIVVDALGAKAVLVGDNFRFGHNQSGDTHLLSGLGRRYGFDTQVVGAVKWRGRIVSSSEVRRLIRRGDVATTCRFLKRPYAIAGDVVRGHGIGAKQVVPTLNLRTSAEILPEDGVYITRTQDLDTRRRWNSITNIGFRPTFGGDRELSVETFLLDPLEGATPVRIRLEFLRRVREERKFESPEALKAQVLRDVAHAQTFFRRLAKTRV